MSKPTIDLADPFPISFFNEINIVGLLYFSLMRSSFSPMSIKSGFFGSLLIRLLILISMDFGLYALHTENRYKYDGVTIREPEAARAENEACSLSLQEEGEPRPHMLVDLLHPNSCASLPWQHAF